MPTNKKSIRSTLGETIVQKRERAAEIERSMRGKVGKMPVRRKVEVVLPMERFTIVVPFSDSRPSQQIIDHFQARRLDTSKIKGLTF